MSKQLIDWMKIMFHIYYIGKIGRRLRKKKTIWENSCCAIENGLFKKIDRRRGKEYGKLFQMTSHFLWRSMISTGDEIKKKYSIKLKFMYILLLTRMHESRIRLN